MATTKLAVSKKTATILRRVIKNILNDPDTLWMDTWGESYDDSVHGIDTFRVNLGRTSVEQKVPACRTTGCVAGQTVLATRAGLNFLRREGTYKRLPNGVIRASFPYTTPDTAAKLLGLSERQASKLFYLPSWGYTPAWPKKFETQYNKARTAKARAKVTAARIEYFIATGD